MGGVLVNVRLLALAEISPLNTGLEHLKPHNGLNFYASDRLGRPSIVNLGIADR